MKRQSPTTSRRKFLKSCAAIGTFTVLPSYMVLGNKSAGSGLPPSERLNLALVGIGNRGNANRLSFLNTGLCNVVALCDVDMQGSHTLTARYEHQILPRPLGEPTEILDAEGLAETPAEYPKARVFTDFRRMFDAMASDIDAVVISTPDHSHFSVAMLAMSLGKPVYVEKPLAHTFGQCQRLIDLAHRSGVVTQMGNQGHSGPNYFQFKEWEQAGIIKDVTRITAFMNEPRRWHDWGSTITRYPDQPVPVGLDWDTWIDSAAAHPFSDKLHPGNWRSWFDHGSGAFGDWGPHILDTAHRFLQLGLPERVTALRRDGANPLVYPQASTIRFDFPARKNMPPCVVTWYDGLDNVPEIEPELGGLVTDETTGITTRQPVDMEEPGKIIYAKDHVFKGTSHADILRILPMEKFLDMRKDLPQFPQKNSNHYANFLLACKGEEDARSPFAVSGPLTQVFNIGVLAQRLGIGLEVDRETGKITNSELANALLDPPPRRGWEEFYRL